MHRPPEPPDPVDAATPRRPDESAPSADGAHVMGLLHEHVPLTLLADLAELPSDPGDRAAGSRAILEAEGEPEQAWWAPSVPQGAHPPSAGPAEG